MFSQFSIRAEGDKVLLILNGRLIAELPWEAALELSRGLTIKARAAEEYAKHDLIIADQAILLKAGAPFGLTRHPAIMREAIKAAGGIKSQSVVGTPTIVRHPPPRKEATNGHNV